LKNNKLLIALPLLFISVFAYLPGTFHSANATLTGNVCLQPDGTPGCPGAPVLFASSGGTLRVAVNIAGSDPLNGFDVSISATNAVLQATGVDTTGSVLTSPTILLECLDGVIVQGTVCASQDGPGVLHLAATQLGPTVSGNGLLFTAIYNVLSATPGIPVDFAVDTVDCASSSVSGGVCVTISNGTATPNSEMTTGATFSNLSDYAVTASPSALTQGPGDTGTSTITFTSFGGFSDFIDITVTGSAGLTASCVDATVFLPSNGIVTTSCSFSAAVVGSYSATVTGVGETSPFVTHSVTIPVTVESPGFAVSASPASLNIAPGSSDSSMITVSSIAGFTDTISLSATVSPAGPTASLGSSSVSIPPDATVTLTVTVPGGTPSGVYMVTVTGTSSGSVSHSAVVTVNVGEPDFSFNAVPNVQVIPRASPSSSGVAAIDVGSINNFAASITLTFTVSGPVAQDFGNGATEVPGGQLSASLSTTTLVLTSGGTDTATLLLTVNKSTGTGLDTVTITATGGGKTHVLQELVYVVDFTLSLRDPVITLINDPATILANPVQTVMTDTAVGAPNQSIWLGPVIAAAVPLLNAAYTYSPSSGRVINQLPSTDATMRRCFMAVFDSSNNLITPVLSGSHVASFAAPVVHVNGDLDGDPVTWDGCRFDSGAGELNFGGGPAPGVNTGDPTIQDFPMPTVEVLPNTPNGQYTAHVCLQSGADINCAALTIILVAPPAAPSFNQFGWKSHKLSLSKTTVQVFTVGVSNPANNTAGVPNPTLFLQVIIVAVDGSGNTATAMSGVITAPPGKNTNNIQINLDVSGLLGVVSFSASIQYGVASPFLTENSAANLGTAGKSTGTFLVTP
jgi:hypothetical protein